LVVVVLPELSEFLEIADPLVSETGPSGFAELGSTELISTLYIGQNPDDLVWEIGTCDFSRIYNFPSI
jgi:hypothetical protein